MGSREGVDRDGFDGVLAGGKGKGGSRMRKWFAVDLVNGAEGESQIGKE